MDRRAPPLFRPHLEVLTERSRPEPIFIVAWTGVDFWLRVEVATSVLIQSMDQRRHEIGRVIHYYAVWGARRGPFGKIIGCVFHSRADRATSYGVEGVATGDKAEPRRRGEVSFGLR
jgi:hypothetical protein